MEVNAKIEFGKAATPSNDAVKDAIAKNLGKEDDIRIGAIPARENEPPFIVADTSRLQKEGRWCQKYSLEEGIMDTISWWKNYGNYRNFKN